MVILTFQSLDLLTILSHAMIEAKEEYDMVVKAALIVVHRYIGRILRRIS